MATTQPTPPPNPTTDREETPPTTNQQTQEQVDLLTTSDRPATESKGTGTELRVPVTSETTADLPILRPGESTDIGLIAGIVTTVTVVIVSVVTVLVIIAVLFKRRGNMVLNKRRALSNPVYSIKGQ